MAAITEDGLWELIIPREIEHDVLDRAASPVNQRFCVLLLPSALAGPRGWGRKVHV